MVPDGIRDADANPARRDPELKGIYNELVKVLRENGAENLTLSYHLDQVEMNSSVVDTLRSWGIHTDNDVPADQWDWPGNSARYEGKVNLNYSTEGGARQYGGHDDGRSYVVHEALVSKKIYPLGAGAWPTHVLLLGQKKPPNSICRPVLCSAPSSPHRGVPADTRGEGNVGGGRNAQNPPFPEYAAGLLPD